MHNGSLATLADVVRHYSEISPDRLHSDGETKIVDSSLSNSARSPSSLVSSTRSGFWTSRFCESALRRSCTGASHARSRSP